MRKQFLLLFIFLLPTVNLFAQIATNDSLKFIDHALANAKKLYEDQIGFQSGIYNGREYISYDYRIKGHPYFDNDYFNWGSVTYFNQSYDSVMLKYNIHLNQLVIEYYDYRGVGKEISLNMDRVSYFDILGHQFYKIQGDSVNDELRPGFYDKLFAEGSFEILVNRKKELNEDIVEQQLKREFLIIDRYYLIINEQVYKVNNKNAVLKVYKDHKKELKRFIRNNFIDFKKDFESGLLLTTEYYLNNFADERN